MKIEDRKALEAVERRIEEIRRQGGNGKIEIMVERGKPTWVYLHVGEKVECT